MTAQCLLRLLADKIEAGQVIDWRIELSEPVESMTILRDSMDSMTLLTNEATITVKWQET